MELLGGFIKEAAIDLDGLSAFGNLTDSDDLKNRGVPVRELSSGLTNTNDEAIRHAGAHLEGDNAKCVALTVKVGKVVGVSCSVGGDPKHGLTTNAAGVGCGGISTVPNNRVIAVGVVKSTTTVGCEVEVLISAVSDVLLLSYELDVTAGSTNVLKCATLVASLYVVVSALLAFSHRTSGTSSRSLTGSGSEIVAKRGNLGGSLGNCAATNGTLGNVLTGTNLGTSRSVYSLKSGLAGSTGCEVTGGSLTSLTGSKNLTGSGSIVVLVSTCVVVTKLTGPLCATSCILGHLVIKSSALSGYGISSATAVNTASGLGTVDTALCSAFVVSILAPLVALLCEFGILGLVEVLGGCDLATLPAFDNHIVATGSCTGCRMIILLHCSSALGVVAKSRNSILFYSHSLTSGALSAIGKTGLGTGSILAGNNSVAVVTKLSNRLLFYSHSLTYGTLLTIGKTVLSTGCGSTGKSLEGVAVCTNFFLRNSPCLTNRALLTVGKTGGGTSSCSTGYVNLGVCKLCNSGLFLSNSVTYRTFLSLSKAGRSTGRSNCLKSHFGVTVGSSFCFVTSLTGFGRCTGSCCPVMSCCLALSSVTLGTGLGSCTSRFCPFVLALSGCFSKQLVEKCTRRECE